MNPQDEQRRAHEIRAACRGADVLISMDTAVWLVRQRFAEAWIPWLLAEAKARPGARDSTFLVGKWLREGSWVPQMLVIIGRKAGIGSDRPEGAMVKAWQRMAKASLLPWELVALLRAAGKLERVKDPAAYVAGLLRDGTWRQFTGRIETMEAKRDRVMAPAAVVNLVSRVLRESDERAGSANHPAG